MITIQHKLLRNQIMSPLLQCLDNSIKFQIIQKIIQGTHRVDNNFETSKQKVFELPVLTFPDFNKVFQVECDASGSAIGDMLSQEGKLVSFFSENLNDAKRKYSMYDQEFYAIIQALKNWRHYLIPNEFVLYTNHKALQQLGS